MGLLPDIGYPQTGDKAKIGTYACMNCSHDVQNDGGVIFISKEKKLPKCPVCEEYTYWMPI